MRERSYYTQERPEISRLINAQPGQWVLDVGCGEGGLGRILKQMGCRVVGIEVEPGAAIEAEKHYDRVYVADMDSFDLPFDGQSFDHIVCADVLEHLRNPWGVLARLCPLLKSEGSLVASIPNIRNVETIADLLKGNFNYSNWGIMDETHLRFFTRRSIEKMFVDAGYAVRDVRLKFDPNCDRILALWNRHGLGGRIRELVLLLGGAPFEPTDRDLKEMLVIQFFIIAARRP
jgi:2-polyprenyl-3-methyl-5-hydroxy-6-metoxy-1,4-benzoquinol methylase